MHFFGSTWVNPQKSIKADDFLTIQQKPTLNAVKMCLHTRNGSDMPIPKIEHSSRQKKEKKPKILHPLDSVSGPRPCQGRGCEYMWVWDEEGEGPRGAVDLAVNH